MNSIPLRTMEDAIEGHVVPWMTTKRQDEMPKVEVKRRNV